MLQVSWRASDELVERVKFAAARAGKSMNEYLTQVLDAATNPELAGDEAEQVRERLAAVGLLAKPGEPRIRPDREAVRQARAAGRRGKSAAEIVAEDRG
ncbi:transcriptional regulator [Saccharopolyspora sp. 5N708]|uniref:transcriptional regulator n=1 Tax=Saccharopolyspora sp. 5N708 TaxID=3457424 RepID=UPI003FD6AE41